MMEKFNKGNLFTSMLSGESYNGPHGRDSDNTFALCPYGKSKSLPFCDSCGQQAKPKTQIQQVAAK